MAESASRAVLGPEPGLTIVCMPSTDAELCGVVRRLYNSIPSVTPARLQDALREVYPHAVVGRLELPEEPMPMWLVYRDGPTTAQPGQSGVT
jgi:hypothetical protein